MSYLIYLENLEKSLELENLNRFSEKIEKFYTFNFIIFT